MENNYSKKRIQTPREREEEYQRLEDLEELEWEKEQHRLLKIPWQ